MIRTYVVMYVVHEWITLLSGCMCLLRRFFATIRKHVPRQKLSQNKKRHRIFARKRYTVKAKRFVFMVTCNEVNGISVSPSWFRCALNS